MAQRGFLLVVVFLVLVGGAQAVDTAYFENAENTTVVNETWTPDAGNVTELANSNLSDTVYFDNETVFNETDTEMTEGTDYEYFTANGTIKTLTGGDLEGDASANITYTFKRTDSLERNMVGTFGALFSAGTVIVLALAAVLLIGVVRALGGV